MKTAVMFKAVMFQQLLHSRLFNFDRWDSTNSLLVNN